MPPQQSRQTIDDVRLLVCEGIADAAFFRHLIAARGLPSFCIRTTGDSGGPGGNSGFEEFLRGVPAWPDFYNLQHIILVSDNDTDAAASFASIRNQLIRAAPTATPPVNYGTPAQPQTRVAGTPASMTIMMLPWVGILGTLETLCMQAITRAHAAGATCVNQFAQCTGAAAWSLNDLSKMEVSSYLAAHHRPNPWIGLQNIWTDNPSLIPLSDVAFDQIAQFLATF